LADCSSTASRCSSCVVAPDATGALPFKPKLWPMVSAPSSASRPPIVPATAWLSIEPIPLDFFTVGVSVATGLVPGLASAVFAVADAVELATVPVFGTDEACPLVDDVAAAAEVVAAVGFAGSAGFAAAAEALALLVSLISVAFRSMMADSFFGSVPVE
jgi:hypothetical protein